MYEWMYSDEPESGRWFSSTQTKFKKAGPWKGETERERRWEFKASSEEDGRNISDQGKKIGRGKKIKRRGCELC